MKIFIYILFLTICISSIYVYSYQFTDSFIVPKWYAVGFIFLIGVVTVSIATLRLKCVKIDINVFGLIILFCCLSQAIFGLAQFFDILPTHSIYKVVGNFDNPAGYAACLSIGFPFIGFLLNNKTKYIKNLGWGMAVIIVVAVIASESRAGILSITIAVTIFFCYNYIRRRSIRLLSIFCIAVLSIFCYLVKKDSADGRIFIWACCAPIIIDSPVIGHGCNSFASLYMDSQAKYFKTKGIHNRYAQLADNVKQPFNEYLSIILNYGIVGIIIFFIFISILVYNYKAFPYAKEKQIAAYSLIIISLFSFFSYPFTYPFTWVVTLISIYIILNEDIKNRFFKVYKLSVINLLIICFSSFSFYKLVQYIHTEYIWNEISNKALRGKLKETLPIYKKIYERFYKNPYYLYNYAMALNMDKQFEESLLVATLCDTYWSDYDLELLIGENCQHLCKYGKAEMHYTKAHFMCPSRFIPLYKLYHLYKRTNDYEKMQEIASAILHKEMKIKEDPISIAIKKEIESLYKLNQDSLHEN